MLRTILLVLLILLLIGSFPVWPYSAGWGYYPTGGLGTLLMSSAEAELKQAGCDYVSLEVAVDNEPALRFYKKHGYSVLKVLPRYYLDSIDGLLMGKKL